MRSVEIDMRNAKCEIDREVRVRFEWKLKGLIDWLIDRFIDELMDQSVD